MNIGNWITIGIAVIGWVFTLAIKFNDVKHLTDDVDAIKKDVNDLGSKLNAHINKTDVAIAEINIRCSERHEVSNE